LTKAELDAIRIAPLFGFAFVMFWHPYSRVLSHRSIWSHLPILGTLIRVAYMASGPVMWSFVSSVADSLVWHIVGLVGLYLALCTPLFGPLVIASGLVGWKAASGCPLLAQMALWATVGGLMVGDALHWVWDGCPLN